MAKKWWDFKLIPRGAMQKQDSLPSEKLVPMVRRCSYASSVQKIIGKSYELSPSSTTVEILIFPKADFHSGALD